MKKFDTIEGYYNFFRKILGDTPKERILNFLTLQASGILNEID